MKYIYHARKNGTRVVQVLHWRRILHHYRIRGSPFCCVARPIVTVILIPGSLLIRTFAMRLTIRQMLLCGWLNWCLHYSRPTVFTRPRSPLTITLLKARKVRYLQCKFQLPRYLCKRYFRYALTSRISRCFLRCVARETCRSLHLHSFAVGNMLRKQSVERNALRRGGRGRGNASQRETFLLK